ncbi:MAG: chorismate mutase [Clostridia bacterium]|nr:chorismate mutase [Clostridia bacterium]
MEELQKTRAALDEVDREIVRLFEKRMLLSRDVAAYKIAHAMPVLDRSREEQVLASRCAMLQDAHWAPSVRELFVKIMALSRAEQERLLEAKDHA